MPSKSNQNQTMKTWDSYVNEAEQPPFVIKVTDSKSIEVEQPNGGQLIDATELGAEGSIREQLVTLCGDAFEEIEPLIRKAPGKVIPLLVRDLMAHFDLGEDIASSS